MPNSAHEAFHDLAAAWLFCLTDISPCPLCSAFLSHLEWTSASVSLTPTVPSPHPGPHSRLFSTSNPSTCFPPVLSFPLEGIFCLTNLHCRTQEGRGCPASHTVAFPVPAPLLAHNRCSINNC